MTKLISKPYVARINTISVCNLRCIGCKGNGIKHINESPHVLDVNEYQIAIKKLEKHLLFVILYDEGEPLLNSSIISIIESTAARNIGTVISTNFSLNLDDAFLMQLASSGLSRLIVAFDGISQETYSRYRVGGNINLVKENLVRFNSFRKQNKKFPIIEIQFLDFGYNSEDMQKIKDFGASIDAEIFTRIFGNGPEGPMGYNGDENARRKIGCSYLWSTIDINNDGLVYPCDYGEDYGMEPVGNILKEELDDLWNNKTMIDMRKSFKSYNCNLKSQCCKCPESESALPILR